MVWLIIFFALSVSLPGCGYQFRVQGAGPTVGGAPEAATTRPHAPRLAILPIANSTYEANFEVKLANYLDYATEDFDVTCVGSSRLGPGRKSWALRPGPISICPDRSCRSRCRP